MLNKKIVLLSILFAGISPTAAIAELTLVNPYPKNCRCLLNDDGSSIQVELYNRTGLRYHPVLADGEDLFVENNCVGNPWNNDACFEYGTCSAKLIGANGTITKIDGSCHDTKTAMGGMPIPGMQF